MLSLTTGATGFGYINQSWAYSDTDDFPQIIALKGFNLAGVQRPPEQDEATAPPCGQVQ